MVKDAIYCNHANEMPASCPCDDDCYCKENSCKPIKGRTKVSKLTRSEIEDASKLLGKFNAINERLRERITEIAKIICQEFGGKFEDWSYCRCDDCRGMNWGEDCEYSNVHQEVYGKSDRYGGKPTGVFKVEIEFDRDDDDDDDDFYSYVEGSCMEDGIPVDFLFMDNKEVKHQVQDVIKKYRKKQQAKIAKKKSNVAKQKDLAKAAKKKLTSAEQKALGI